MKLGGSPYRDLPFEARGDDNCLLCGGIFPILGTRVEEGVGGLVDELGVEVLIFGCVRGE
jgi:hypothetical protein